MGFNSHFRGGRRAERGKGLGLCFLLMVWLLTKEISTTINMKEKAESTTPVQVQWENVSTIATSFFTMLTGSNMRGILKMEKSTAKEKWCRPTRRYSYQPGRTERSTARVSYIKQMEKSIEEYGPTMSFKIKKDLEIWSRLLMWLLRMLWLLFRRDNNLYKHLKTVRLW